MAHAWAEVWPFLIWTLHCDSLALVGCSAALPRGHCEPLHGVDVALVCFSLFPLPIAFGGRARSFAAQLTCPRPHGWPAVPETGSTSREPREEGHSRACLPALCWGGGPVSRIVLALLGDPSVGRGSRSVKLVPLPIGDGLLRAGGPSAPHGFDRPWQAVRGRRQSQSRRDITVMLARSRPTDVLGLEIKREAS